MDPDLLTRLTVVVRVGDKIATLSAGRPNEVIAIGSDGVWVETEKSAGQNGPRLVPAWMFNEAWRLMQTDRILRNTELIKTVKRSSAVLALLAELPEVSVMSTRPLVLRMD